MLPIQQMTARKRIPLVAHDHQKASLLDWACYNRKALSAHHIIATGATGRLLEGVLGLPIERLRSGPLGGDQQLGAKIAEGEVDALIFFWDPLEPAPHDPDVKALLRIAVMRNVPVACNRASADFMFASPPMSGPYDRQVPDNEADTTRSVGGSDGEVSGRSETPAPGIFPQANG